MIFCNNMLQKTWAFILLQITAQSAPHPQFHQNRFQKNSGVYFNGNLSSRFRESVGRKGGRDSVQCQVFYRIIFLTKFVTSLT